MSPRSVTVLKKNNILVYSTPDIILQKRYKTPHTQPSRTPRGRSPQDRQNHVILLSPEKSKHQYEREKETTAKHGISKELVAREPRRRGRRRRRRCRRAVAAAPTTKERRRPLHRLPPGVAGWAPTAVDAAAVVVPAIETRLGDAAHARLAPGIVAARRQGRRRREANHVAGQRAVLLGGRRGGVGL